MGENRNADKILLYYNPHSGSGVFKNNLDYIVDAVRRPDISSYRSEPQRI